MRQELSQGTVIAIISVIAGIILIGGYFLFFASPSSQIDRSKQRVIPAPAAPPPPVQ